MQVQRQLNLTPFATELGVTADRDGRELVVALLKATYAFTATGKVDPAAPAQQLPVLLADVFYGDPAASGLFFASDLVPEKPGTDVAIHGHVYGRGKPTVDAGFGLERLTKTIVAYGTRTWAGGWPSPIVGPMPLQQVELRYENAFGGSYPDEKGDPVVFVENPVGIGFAPSWNPGTPLPSLELPGQPVQSSRGNVHPGGLGFIAPGWAARARLGGTHDAAWMKHRRPLPPEDLDPRFYHAVPLDQVFLPRLAGGERMALLRLHPEAEKVVLGLPADRFVATLRYGGKGEERPMVADTLVVEPDEGRLAITHRASLVVDDPRRVESVVFRKVGAKPA